MDDKLKHRLQKQNPIEGVESSTYPGPILAPRTGNPIEGVESPPSPAAAGCPPAGIPLRELKGAPGEGQGAGRGRIPLRELKA